MTNFRENPDVLGNMRICLRVIARMKGVKLLHPVGEYDMDTMLNMFKDMEEMPDYHTPKDRLIDFKNDAIIFGLTVVLRLMRCIILVLGKIFGGDVEQMAQKFLAETKNHV